MGLRRLLVLLIAVLAAGGTAFFARSWIQGQQANVVAVVAPESADEEIYEVLVAEEDLAIGIFLKPEHFRWQRWPTDDLPETYVLKGLRSENEMIGAVVRRGLAAGNPITDGSVVKPGERGFLAAVLDPGMRAVSVPITPTSSNAGLIFPGDRVDLILTQTLVAEDGETTRRVSETVLQDIRIIAIGSDVRDNADGSRTNEKARTATFEVTPPQAEKVALVTELGKLSLSLRSLATEGSETPIAALDPDQPFTWDRDVSQVLRSGNLSTRLQVLRGSETSDVTVRQGAN